MRAYLVSFGGFTEGLSDEEMLGSAASGIAGANKAVEAVEIARRELAPDPADEAEEIDIAIGELERAYVALRVYRERLSVSPAQRRGAAAMQRIVQESRRWSSYEWVMVALIGMGTVAAVASVALALRLYRMGWW